MLLRPIKQRILVRRCVNGDDAGDGYRHDGGIILPHMTADRTFMAEIIGLSDDCKLFHAEHVGSFVNIPMWKPQYMNRVEDEVFAIRESFFENEGMAAVFTTN